MRGYSLSTPGPVPAMRSAPLIALAVLLTAWKTFAQPPQAPPPPVAESPDPDPFSSPFFTAPNTRTLPNGRELPPPTPEALLGPGKSLCRECFWFSADFFYAAGSRTQLPALVTLSAPNTLPTEAGVLGRPTTRVGFGGNQLSELRPALRAEAGMWLGEHWAVDGTFLYTSAATASFSGVSQPGGTIVARPVITGVGEGSVLLGQFQPDAVSASAGSRLIGGDVNLRRNLLRNDFSTWDLFAGYRYLNLRDTVRVTHENTLPPANILMVPGAPVPFTRNVVDDRFRTLNQFHGPQVGIASTHRLFDRWTFSTRLGVAVGVTLSQTTLAGTTTANGMTSAGGLLVGGTNAGRYEDSHFSVVPTADMKLGYDVTDWLRLNVGYSFLYWSRVERAGDQIDRAVFTGRPSYPGQTTGYWLQGVTLGAEVRY